MRKSRFTESRFIKVLKEVEGGRQVAEVHREYGISDATCGLDLQAYLLDVLARLPTTKYSDIDNLLPHNWSPAIKV